MPLIDPFTLARLWALLSVASTAVSVGLVLLSEWRSAWFNAKSAQSPLSPGAGRYRKKSGQRPER
jgi:hypothetical protein